MLDFDKTRFAIYVHWPFCESKCPYCDFNSHVRESVDQSAWREAYLREIMYSFQHHEKNTITSVFFGGGTPSLMSPETVSSILNALDKYWGLGTNCEITLEANPSSVETSKLRNFYHAGINRLSLGIQSLRPEHLKFLGRRHNEKQALQAIEQAGQIFQRFSFDLIYALPKQSLNEWVYDLEAALNLAGDHLSLYALTIEPNTVFARQVTRGDWAPKNDDEISDFLNITNEIMSSRKFYPYEISNYAKNDAVCRHNLTYWRYQSYIGIGPGAHGRFRHHQKTMASQNIKLPEAWIKSVHNQGHGLENITALDDTTQYQECLMMGLRLSEGLDMNHAHHMIGNDLASKIPPDRLQTMMEHGWIVWDKHQNTLRLTPEGRMRCDGITRYLLT